MAWPVPPEISEPQPPELRRQWGKVPHAQRYRTQRNDLLRAAARLVSRNGYQGTRISDIVAEAGLSKGTFYEHFDSKQDCFVELYRRTNSGMLRAGIAAAEANFSQGAYTTILEVIRALTSYVAQDPRLAQALRVESGSSQPAIDAQRRDNLQRTIELFVVIGKRLGTDVDEHELELTCSVVVQGVIAILPELRAQRAGFDAELQAVTRMACRALNLPDTV
jgi:AcrR family transcriptional regulator